MTIQPPIEEIISGRPFVLHVLPDGQDTRVAAANPIDAFRRHIADMMQTGAYRPAEHGAIKVCVDHPGIGRSYFVACPHPVTGKVNYAECYNYEERFFDDDGEEDFSIDLDAEAELRGEY